MENFGRYSRNCFPSSLIKKEINKGKVQYLLVVGFLQVKLWKWDSIHGIKRSLTSTNRKKGHSILVEKTYRLQ